MIFKEQLPEAEGVLPKKFQNIVVKKPDNDIRRPGGAGLDDFAGLLESRGQTLESEWSKSSDARDLASDYLDVRVAFSPIPKNRQGMRCSCSGFCCQH